MAPADRQGMQANIEEDAVYIKYKLPDAYCYDSAMVFTAGKCSRVPVHRLVRDWHKEIIEKRKTRNRKNEEALYLSHGNYDSPYDSPSRESRLKDVCIRTRSDSQCSSDSQTKSESQINTDSISNDSQFLGESQNYAFTRGYLSRTRNDSQYSSDSYSCGSRTRNESQCSGDAGLSQESQEEEDSKSSVQEKSTLEVEEFPSLNELSSQLNIEALTVPQAEQTATVPSPYDIQNIQFSIPNSGMTDRMGEQSTLLSSEPKNSSHFQISIPNLNMAEKTSNISSGSHISSPKAGVKDRMGEQISLSSSPGPSNSFQFQFSIPKLNTADQTTNVSSSSHISSPKAGMRDQMGEQNLLLSSPGPNSSSRLQFSIPKLNTAGPSPSNHPPFGAGGEIVLPLTEKATKDNSKALTTGSTAISQELNVASLKTAPISSPQPSLSTLATLHLSQPQPSLSTLASANLNQNQSNLFSVPPLSKPQPSLSSLATTHLNQPQPTLSSLAMTHLNQPQPNLSSLATTHLNQPQPNLSSLVTTHLNQPQPQPNLSSLATTHLNEPHPDSSSLATTHLSQPQPGEMTVQNPPPLGFPSPLSFHSPPPPGFPPRFPPPPGFSSPPGFRPPPSVLNSLRLPSAGIENSPKEEFDPVLSQMFGDTDDSSMDIDLQSALVKTPEMSNPSIYSNSKHKHGDWVTLENNFLEYDRTMLKRTPSVFGCLVSEVPPKHRVKRLSENTISVPFRIFRFDTPSPDELVHNALMDPKNPARYQLITRERLNRR